MSNSRMLEIAPPSVGAMREGRSNSWSLQLCLYCFFSFLCCVENNDCGQPYGMTSVSVDCGSYDLSWRVSGDLEDNIQELRLSVSCEQVNNSQMRVFSKTYVAASTSYFMRPLEVNYTPHNGEICHYGGCVIDDAFGDIYTFPTVSCTGDTSDVVLQTPSSLSWPGEAVSSSSTASTSPPPDGPNFPSTEVLEDYTTQAVVWPSETTGADKPSSLVADSSLSFTSSNISGDGTQEIFTSFTSLSGPPPGKPAPILLLAVALGIALLVIVTGSFIASLAIYYLVAAHRNSALMKSKRVMDYYFPAKFDSEKDLEHVLFSPYSPNLIRPSSSTTSIATALDGFLDPISLESSSPATPENDPSCHLEDPVQWNRNIIRLPPDDSSGESSCHTWNGYLINLHNHLASGSSNSCHPHHFDEACDCRNSIAELSGKRSAACPAFFQQQNETPATATCDDSGVWVDISLEQDYEPSPIKVQTRLVMIAHSHSEDNQSPEPTLEGSKQSEMQGINFSGTIQQGNSETTEALNKYVMDCTTKVDSSTCDEDISLDYSGMEHACACSSSDSRPPHSSVSASPASASPVSASSHLSPQATSHLSPQATTLFCTPV